MTRNYRRIFLPPFESFSSLRKACDSTIITYAEDVEITKDEVESGVRRGGRWVFYSTWEMAEPPEGGWEGGGRGRGRDLVLVHGKLPGDWSHNSWPQGLTTTAYDTPFTSNTS